MHKTYLTDIFYILGDGNLNFHDLFGKYIKKNKERDIRIVFCFMRFGLIVLKCFPLLVGLYFIPKKSTFHYFSMGIRRSGKIIFRKELNA